MEHEFGKLISLLNMEAARREFTIYELSTAMGLHKNTLYNIRAGKQPGLEICTKIADYMNLPLELVLYYAGKLDEPPPTKLDPEILALARRMGAAQPDQRDGLFQIIRAALDSMGL